VTRSAVVLGSTQSLDDVDQLGASSAGLDVVRRRSGGGAVLVEPGAMAWVDVLVPRSDPLWDDDVGRAFWWLGETWRLALASLGVTGAEVHRGGIVTSRWSSKVCFAGLGPGEVTVEGRKMVGMAQRRTRDGALFQCAVPLRWEPQRLLDVLALGAEERAEAAATLNESVRVLDCGLDDVEAALVAELP
jgi:lipoate-protein ligase A